MGMLGASLRIACIQMRGVVRFTSGFRQRQAIVGYDSS